MKLTFPHMGISYIPVKVLFDTLGIDYYMPATSSRKSFENGIKNSPEFMCLPFKTILGNMMEGLDNGADTILFGGGCGQCRQSYFGDLLQEILRSLGYQFKYVYLELYNLSYQGVIEAISPLIGGKSKGLIVKAATDAAWTVFAADGIYALARKTRCREAVRGETDAIISQFEHQIQTVRGFKDIKGVLLDTKKKLKGIQLDPARDPVKVLLVGEIFLASDMFTNLEIEKKLGDIGVDVTNTMGVAEWIRHHFLQGITPIKTKEKPIKAAYEFMRTEGFGGHGIYTVGNSVLGSLKDYDGIIQVYPFTCMPEIIAQCAFDNIQKRYGIPIMPLIFDEMTGEAGYMTRIEAFTDMLLMRRENRAKLALTGKGKKIIRKL